MLIRYLNVSTRIETLNHNFFGKLVWERSNQKNVAKMKKKVRNVWKPV